MTDVNKPTRRCQTNHFQLNVDELYFYYTPDLIIAMLLLLLPLFLVLLSKQQCGPPGKTIEVDDRSTNHSQYSSLPPPLFTFDMDNIIPLSCRPFPETSFCCQLSLYPDPLVKSLTLQPDNMKYKIMSVVHVIYSKKETRFQCLIRTQKNVHIFLGVRVGAKELGLKQVNTYLSRRGGNILVRSFPVLWG